MNEIYLFHSNSLSVEILLQKAKQNFNEDESYTTPCDEDDDDEEDDQRKEEIKKGKANKMRKSDNHFDIFCMFLFYQRLMYL